MRLTTVALVLGLCSAAPAQLDLRQGSAAGAAGVIHIWADPPGAGQVFDRWTGDTAAIADVRSFHTTLKPGTGPITLAAQYRDAPAWTPRTERINNTETVHHIPARPIGVIFRFHGAGGSAAGQFAGGENAIFNGAAAANNWAIVALDSTDRTARQWDTRNSLENPDVRNVQAVVAELIRRGAITASTPLFGMGISNGGAFASRAVNLLRWRGAAIYIASGIEAVVQASDIPTVWGMQEFDNLIGAEGNLRAAANFNSLRRKGVGCHYYMNQPAPVYPERFWRIPGLTKTDSQTIFNALRTAGILTPENMVAAGVTAQQLTAAIPQAYRANAGNIGDQLKASAAEHEFFSDFAHRMLDFFAARLAAPDIAFVSAATFSAGASAPGAIVSGFSARLPPGDLTVTFRDSAGVERPARVLGSGSGQVNFVVPEDAAQGLGYVTVRGASGEVAAPLDLKAVSPGLFSETFDGKGRAAATVLRAGEDVYLTLYATGIRNVTGASRLIARVNGVDARVAYAGPQGEFPGLDQINLAVREPGLRLVPVTILAEGQAATTLEADLGGGN